MPSRPLARPNVVYIDCHDLGDWLGCYGRPYVRSPHLDRLAAQGASFTNYFATAPICIPSRASIFTGRMPHSAGVTGQDFLADDQVCLPEYFHRGGYETVLAGGLMIRNDPAWVGFERRLPATGRHDLSGAPGATGTLERVAARFLRERAGSRAGRPFYLSLSFQLVHRPYGLEHDPEVSEAVEVPPPLPDLPPVRKDLATLCHNVVALDARVGVVLDALNESGLQEDTVVVFTTDHGPALARAKHTLYDPGIKTALVVRFPSVVTPGRRDQLLSNVDLLPTLLDLVGLPAPAGILGQSFLPVLQGALAPGRSEVFAEHTWGKRNNLCYYTPARCLRTAHHKLIRNFTRQPFYVDNGWLARFDGCLDVTGRLFGAALPAEELYDLTADPHELRNLADEPAYADQRAALLKRLDAFLEATGDPILRGPVPNQLGLPDVPQWVERPDGSFRFSVNNPLRIGERTFVS